MSSGFKGKKVFLTGGAVRIGAMIVRRLAAKGAEVVFTYNKSEDAAFRLLEELGGRKAGHTAFRLDLSRKIPESIFKPFGKIDFLINNASIFFPKNITQENFDEFELQMRINFTAPVFLSKIFARNMKDGAIVNILDCRINSLERAEGSYWLSKKSLQNATELLAVQLAPRIRVNAVAPGAMLPPSTASGDFSAQKAAEAAPLRKLPEMNDLLDAVLFLLVNESVTGQTIYVDAGRHLLCASSKRSDCFSDPLFIKNQTTGN